SAKAQGTLDAVLLGEYAKAKEAHAALQHQSAIVGNVRSNLLPRNRTEWRRVTIGYGTLCFLAVLALVSLSDTRKTPDPALAVASKATDDGAANDKAAVANLIRDLKTAEKRPTDQTG